MIFAITDYNANVLHNFRYQVSRIVEEKLYTNISVALDMENCDPIK